ncbi:hypothetical protein DFQ26_003551 [Actinomortierella ambigua]|nr:hypothetical protein DFQ26_003551 [Actinomortierella ambigua]
MSPVSVSSASPSPKPMLKRKPLVHDEAHTSTSLTSSGLPSAAAVAAFAAADVLENAADAEYHHHSTSHHRSLSHPYPPLYHHSLYTPQHQRQLSCSSVTSSAAPSPMMRRQRVSSRAQTPPRQRQLSGSSTCSSSSFSAWPCLSTPGSTCPSLMPSAAASPMAPSSLEPSVEQRKRSRTISHLDRALKEETTPHLLLAQLPPRFGSRSPSMEAAPSPLSTPRSSPSASVTSEDEAKTPSPRETAVAHRSTLDDLVYAISLDEDLTANVKQAMATMDKIASLTSSSVPAVKVTCPSSSSSKEGGVEKLSSSTHTATVPTSTATTTFSTPNKPTAIHRRRMTMGYPGENDPHAIRVVYFSPGCVDDHLARARAL